MATSPEALVEPELLVWARESAGLPQEQVAERLKVTNPLERLAGWEEGTDRPSVSQLRQLARIYKRPLAVFFLREPPLDFMPLRDFRRLGEPVVSQALSPALRFELRRATGVRDVALDLLDLDPQNDTKFELSGSVSDDPDLLAARIRDALEVPAHVQRSWSGSYEPLREWRHRVERLAVLVLQASGIDLEEMRAFSVAEFPVPVICLNSSDHPNGRIFSLMHELVHLVLHRGGICKWEGSGDTGQKGLDIERFCNRVAGAILIPKEDLLEDWHVSRSPEPRDWSDDLIAELARKFSVSREVVLRRLVIVGRATESFYRRKREQLLKQYEKLTPSGRGPAYEKKVVAGLGESFVQLVLSSYYDQRLTLAETSNLLDVRVRTLPAVEQEIMGWSHIRSPMS